MLVEAKDIGDGVRILALNRPPANAINREFNRRSRSSATPRGPTLPCAQ